MRIRSLSLTVALIGATLLVITTDAVTSSSRAQAKGEA